VRRPWTVEQAATIDVDLAAEPIAGRDEQRCATRANDPRREDETANRAQHFRQPPLSNLCDAKHGDLRRDPLEVVDEGVDRRG
jgi:hypothetical protein